MAGKTFFICAVAFAVVAAAELAATEDRSNIQLITRALGGPLGLLAPNPLRAQIRDVKLQGKLNKATIKTNLYNGVGQRVSGLGLGGGALPFGSSMGTSMFSPVNSFGGSAIGGASGFPGSLGVRQPSFGAPQYDPSMGMAAF